MLPRRPFYQFTPQDDEVWQLLYSRQYPRLDGRASQPYYLDGFSALGLHDSPERVPDFATMSQYLQDNVGWELYSTDEIFSEGQTWFEHLWAKQFLISEYIREKDSLDYTPLPDIFHDTFGHLPLMANKRYADLVHRYSRAMLDCAKSKRKGLGAIWWYTIEFGLIREDGTVKALGAGLMSSYGELDHAFTDNVQRLPFDPVEIAKLDHSPHSYHEKLFILEDFDQLEEFVEYWIRTDKGVDDGLTAAEVLSRAADAML